MSRCGLDAGVRRDDAISNHADDVIALIGYEDRPVARHGNAGRTVESRDSGRAIDVSWKATASPSCERFAAARDRCDRAVSGDSPNALPVSIANVENSGAVGSEAHRLHEPPRSSPDHRTCRSLPNRRSSTTADMSGSPRGSEMGLKRAATTIGWSGFGTG